MALGTVTVGTNVNIPLDHCLLVPVSFAGDGAYPTGGTLLFSATTGIAAALHGRSIVGIIPQDCGGYLVTYLPATDALKVYWNQSADDVPAEEVDGTPSLASVTFHLILICR